MEKGQHIVKFGGGYFVMTTREYINLVKSRRSEFDWKDLPYQKATLEDVLKYFKKARKR